MTAWALLLATILSGCASYSADTLVCMGFCAYREHDTTCPQPYEAKKEE